MRCSGIRATATTAQGWSAWRVAPTPSCARRAIAERVGVRRLILTHIPPWTDPNVALAEAEAEYSGPIEGAHSGLELLL